MREKPAAASNPIADLIGRRWSPRAIDSNQPVSRQHLSALQDAVLLRRSIMALSGAATDALKISTR